jgi:regulatory protein
VALITALEKQKRRARVSVDLDGAYAFSLSADLVIERDVRVGAELTEEQRRDLEAEDGRRGAIASALRVLAMSPRSEKDLRSRLGRRGYRRDAIDNAVARMKDLGYLNDATYARSYVEARQASTPRSRRALSFELGRKGVDREVVATAVETLSDEEAAFEAALRRLRALRGLDRQTFIRRLGSFLASRGFGYGVARGAIDRCWLIVNDEEGDRP